MKIVKKRRIFDKGVFKKFNMKRDEYEERKEEKENERKGE